MKKKLLNALTLAVSMAIGHEHSAQAPDLGTSSNFTLFTATGALSNTGPTRIEGNIGVDVGAITGFPPGTATGVIHLTNTTTSQAGIDVNAAYTELNSIECGTPLPALIGNGQVLTPDVYCILTAAVINGELILDAQGDPGAVFILGVNGSLTANELSKITLINSASPLNVYWRVGGQMILGVNAVFRGTAVVDGAIDLLQGAA